MAKSRVNTGTKEASSITDVDSSLVLDLDAYGKECEHVVFYLCGTGTISSGTIKIETAIDPDYTGLWSLLDTVTASDLSGGASVSKHYTAAFCAIRARVSTAIGGGGSIRWKVKGR